MTEAECDALGLIKEQASKKRNIGIPLSANMTILDRNANIPSLELKHEGNTDKEQSTIDDLENGVEGEISTGRKR